MAGETRTAWQSYRECQAAKETGLSRALLIAAAMGAISQAHCLTAHRLTAHSSIQTLYTGLGVKGVVAYGASARQQPWQAIMAEAEVVALGEKNIRKGRVADGALGVDIDVPAQVDGLLGSRRRGCGCAIPLRRVATEALRASSKDVA